MINKHQNLEDKNKQSDKRIMKSKVKINRRIKGRKMPNEVKLKRRRWNRKSEQRRPSEET